MQVQKDFIFNCVKSLKQGDKLVILQQVFAPSMCSLNDLVTDVVKDHQQNQSGVLPIPWP